MQTLSEIRELLASRGLRPRHRLGQNFLHDKNLLAKLVDAAEIESGECVLEVGPGTGTLTEALLARGARVIACELDDDLADLVDERLGDRITLIRGDCLDRHRRLSPRIVDAVADCEVDGDPGFKLVANLPYQIASPLMATLLLHHPSCRGHFVTIQREVADRLIAQPGTKSYGPLSIIIQLFARVDRIATLPPTSFWPAPKVESAMVRVLPVDDGERIARPGDEAEAFARFVTSLFSSRRKQLGRIFGRDRTDWPAGIAPQQRPDALTPQQIASLWRREQREGDRARPRE